ncbi:MAG: cytochrome-c oxidase, cbb3-type subunit I [Nitratireductor sp.]|nr:cytochrome-c oxidase, cbb3-type subunit I [Nitratireductor sp.]
MISTLTISERRLGMVLSAGLALLGLAMSALARHGVMAVHGGMALVLGLMLVFALGGALYDQPEPGSSRLKNYYDAPTRFGITMTLVWAVIGMGAGVWVASLMYWPDANTPWPATSFGRLRPVHTTGVIFGFGGNALIATSFYVLQRTSRARLADAVSPWVVLIGFNLFCAWAVTGYLMGSTQSKEYAEPEWYADLWLVIVWVVYFVLYMRTLARRVEPHIYVANWYYLSFILVVAILHIVNNLAVPIGLTGRSFPIWSGVQDAMIQWWYGHNAVAFFLTTGFLGMLYYFLPVRSGRPIWSYRLSILSFWGIVFFYIWVGSHHLHYTALPYWVQTLGMTFSVMLLVPSWASAGNAIATLNGAWHKVRDDATLRFMFVAAVFYGLSTFEGSFLAIRPVNSLSHYTDWTVGHVHSGTLGWVAMIIFGAIYTLVPKLAGRETMAWPRAIEWHFWLAVGGTLIYVVSMWNAGITQGLMWRTYGENGALIYSFLDTVRAMAPFYLLRAIGGAVFLSGMVIFALNCRATLRTAGAFADAADRPLRVEPAE